MSLTASQKQSYWERVEGALEIAGARPELAANLMPDIESLPEDQQELFYHPEPLDVAKDLSGVERWSNEQIRAYIEQSKTLRGVDEKRPVEEGLARTMKANKRYVAVLIAKIVVLAGLFASSTLAFIGLIAVIPGLILSILISIITLLLFTLSTRVTNISIQFGKDDPKDFHLKKRT